MPRLSLQEWQQLDPVARWLVTCRASVLFMTFTAAVLGGLLAWRADSFSLPLWLATMLGLVLAHASNNMINDYVDSSRGIDKDSYFRNQYGVHVIEDGLMSASGFLRYLGVTAGLALLIGIWLTANRGGYVFDLVLIGAFFVLFYTWPLKQIGLGEPAVLLVWGPLMVGGCFYVQTGTWTAEVLWLSLVFAIGPTAVLFGKHTDKLQADQAKGVRTLPVMLGDQLSRRSTQAMIYLQYLLCIYLVVSGQVHWPLLLVLGAASLLPDINRAFGAPRPATRPDRYPQQIWPLWFSAQAFRHTRRFTSFLLLGVTLDTLLC